MGRLNNPRFRALVVDDEPDIRALLEITLQRMGGETTAASDLGSARKALGDGAFDVCLTDMRLPDGRGLELVRHIQQQHPQLPVAVITAYGNLEDAVESLKAGAFDFVAKPVDLGVLKRLIETALRLDLTPAPTPSDALTAPGLIGEAPAMQQLRNMISKVARSQAPIYISGESGTGKELVARLIHAESPRRDQPFVPVNCGAIQPDLIESELFGHIKGSFTGAGRDKAGLFQTANGGSLFLDEIADLPLNMQVKLLRALQERRIRAVGAESETDVDVRVLCATHRSLSELVARGEFRQDLYYRINVIELKVPALRERPQDIPLLVEHVLARLSRNGPGLSMRLLPQALDALRAYSFPGNVRELENILERAVTLAEGAAITAADLRLTPAALSMPSLDSTKTPPVASVEPASLTGLVSDTERQLIQRALEQARYNKTKAAQLLGISFRALRYRLKKLGIQS